MVLLPFGLMMSNVQQLVTVVLSRHIELLKNKKLRRSWSAQEKVCTKHLLKCIISYIYL